MPLWSRPPRALDTAMTDNPPPQCPLCGGYGPKLTDEPHILRLHPILKAVAKETGLDPYTILKEGRYRQSVDARSIAVHLARKRLGLSLSDLSRWFNRDRTSMRNALERVRNSLQLQEIAERVERNLEK